MKLTKGKISKLYSKKKQSVKKRKHGKKKTYKSKTFRKNKRSNLYNKTFKHLYGGDNDLMNEEQPHIPVNNSDIISSETNNFNPEPVSNISTLDSLDQLNIPETPIMDSSFESPDMNSSLPLETPTMDSSFESPDMNSSLPLETPTMDSSFESPDMNSSLPLESPTSDVISETSIPDSDLSPLETPTPDIISETSIPDSDLSPLDSTPTSDDISETPILQTDNIPIIPNSASDFQTDVIPQEDFQNVGITNDISTSNSTSLQTAVDTLAKEISKNVINIVSKDLLNNINTVTNNIPQNGFDSNTMASATMATSGGKRYKTRKFKWMSKQKHKKTKKH
jgi:hypothetical protein